MNVLIFGVIKWSRIWFFSGLVHVLWLRKLCRDMIQSVNLSFFLAFLNIFTTANILVQCAPTKAIEKWKLCPVHSTFLKLKKIVFAIHFRTRLFQQIFSTKIEAVEASTVTRACYKFVLCRSNISCWPENFIFELALLSKPICHLLRLLSGSGSVLFRSGIRVFPFLVHHHQRHKSHFNIEPCLIHGGKVAETPGA